MVDHRITARRNYKLWRGRTRQYWGTKSHRLGAAAEGNVRRLWPSDVQKLLASRWPEHRDLAQRALRERPALAPRDASWAKRCHEKLLNASGKRPAVNS
jgi:hypothetical protein